MTDLSPVAVSISRPSYHDGRSAISLRIEDRVSGCQIVEIEMTCEAFAEAITGLQSRGGSAKWSPKYLLKRRELKNVFVPTSDTFYSKEKRAEELDLRTKDICVDGWEIHCRSDYGNMHKHSIDKDGNSGYTVGFIRFVDATEEDIAKGFKKNFY